MLFNSLEFIVCFVPLVLLVFGFLKRSGHHSGANLWLTLASFFFYAWWRPVYLPLLLGSILVNHAFGRVLVGRRTLPGTRWILAIGVMGNLALLGYYKYAGFFTTTARQLGFDGVPVVEVFLPLAISFFTFQQIAYLVDCHRGKVERLSLMDYSLFVSFFPQLIAGPIVHHSEMGPQFVRNRNRGLGSDDLGVGLAIFTFGLAKKVLVADRLALSASPVFAHADAGGTVTFVEGWVAALGFGLQLYFDFSGYCDMATGAARCFGITLPINFCSPYKASNIIDFWRRWHITLSRFLKDYLYIPLGGNRRGVFRRYGNLMFTMLVGGLWHGAGWNFVLWGGLHGSALAANHGWRHFKPVSLLARFPRAIRRAVGVGMTLFFVTVAWVFFRATSFQGAIAVLKGMGGVNGVSLPVKYRERWGALGEAIAAQGVEFREMASLRSTGPVAEILVALIFVLTAPNVFQLLAKHRPVLETPQPGRLQLPFNAWSGLVCAVLFVYCLVSLNKVSEFLYFQF